MLNLVGRVQHHRDDARAASIAGTSLTYSSAASFSFRFSFSVVLASPPVVVSLSTSRVVPTRPPVAVRRLRSRPARRCFGRFLGVEARKARQAAALSGCSLGAEARAATTAAMLRPLLLWQRSDGPDLLSLEKRR